MRTPTASRPYMPGYGIAEPEDGQGLLPWSWAEERLVSSHDYWVATSRPDGRPHLMPVWGVWFDDAWWFSSGRRSLAPAGRTWPRRRQSPRPRCHRDSRGQ